MNVLDPKRVWRVVDAEGRSDGKLYLDVPTAEAARRHALRVASSWGHNLTLRLQQSDELTWKDHDDLRSDR